MKKNENSLSLFDGISCARVALHRAGIHVEKYYASEIDKYAIQIAMKNYPDTVQLGSVTKINCWNGNNLVISGEDMERHEVGSLDLLIGGSPCQDLSIAKKNRQGLSGNRSGLFYEYVRILKEMQPKYFILENVNSMPKEAREIITKELGVEPIMIDAALVSAQRRKRLFWTNIPNVQQPEDKGIFLRDILEDIPVPPEGFELKEKSKTLRLGGARSQVGDKHEWDSVFQFRRTYWRETKGGKVPTLTANMGTGGNNVPYILQDDGTLKVREATKKGYAVAHEGDAVDVSFPNSATPSGRVGEKVKNLMTGSNAIHVFTKKHLRRLTPTECERLQCLPDGYTEGISKTQRYKALGNAFNVDVVAHILSFIPRE